MEKWWPHRVWLPHSAAMPHHRAQGLRHARCSPAARPPGRRMTTLNVAAAAPHPPNEPVSRPSFPPGFPPGYARFPSVRVASRTALSAAVRCAWRSSACSSLVPGMYSVMLLGVMPRDSIDLHDPSLRDPGGAKEGGGGSGRGGGRLVPPPVTRPAGGQRRRRGRGQLALWHGESDKHVSHTHVSALPCRVRPQRA